MPVGRLQGLRHGLQLQELAREARAHPRRQVRLRVHRQRLQDEVQLAGRLKRLLRLCGCCSANDFGLGLSVLSIAMTEMTVTI